MPRKLKIPAPNEIERAWSHTAGGLVNTSIRINAIQNLVNAIEYGTIFYKTDGTIEQKYDLLKKELSKYGEIIYRDYESTSKNFTTLYNHYFTQE